mmetsp:Transcript_13344/g.34242  ORF Transcript_13344/g.34242 Transcript_13344/m.34242 type:complete len:211 (+) Transcript_13344:1280-1912(+)
MPRTEEVNTVVAKQIDGRGHGNIPVRHQSRRQAPEQVLEVLEHVRELTLTLVHVVHCQAKRCIKLHQPLLTCRKGLSPSMQHQEKRLEDVVVIKMDPVRQAVLLVEFHQPLVKLRSIEHGTGIQPPHQVFDVLLQEGGGVEFIPGGIRGPELGHEYRIYLRHRLRKPGQELGLHLEIGWNLAIAGVGVGFRADVRQGVGMLKLFPHQNPA